MDLLQDNASKSIASLRQLRADIKAYVKSYMQDSPDSENAQILGREKFRGVRPILKKCKTMADFKALLERRYAGVMEALCKYDKEPPSIDRFERICTVAQDAINISVQNDDSSVAYSECFCKAFDMLSERPKVVNGLQDAFFCEEEQGRIATAAENLFRALYDFNKVYHPHLTQKVIDSYEPPNYIKSIDNNLRQRRDLKAVLFTAEGAFKQECMVSSKDEARILWESIHAIPEALLPVLEVTDLFDEEFFVAASILSFPIQRRFLASDPWKYTQEVRKLILRVRFQVHACEILGEYDLTRARIKDYESKLNGPPDSLCIDEKAATIEKMCKAESHVQKICEALREAGLTLEDLRNLKMPEADSDKNPANSDGNSRKTRERGTSSFPDGKVTSIFEISGNGKFICAGGKSYKITRKSTWEVVDKLLKAANSKEGDGWIHFTGMESNLFRTSTARKFKTNWIEMNTVGRTIVKARLKTSLRP